MHAPGQQLRDTHRNKQGGGEALDRWFHAWGSSTNSALTADAIRSTRWEYWVPIQGTSHKLTLSAPHNGAEGVGGIDPANQPPWVLPRRSHGPRANGKLAPHKKAAGRIAQRQRTKSSWNVYHGSWTTSHRWANTAATE